MADESENNQVTASISKRTNDFNVMRVRLETGTFHATLREYLSGRKESYTENADGTTSLITMNVGKPKCNEEGVGSIMTWVVTRINEHTVQGNFPKEAGGYQLLRDFVANCQIKLGDYLMDNLYNFDITEQEYTSIIETVIDLLERYLSRSYANLERESYGETVKTVESSSIHAKGGGFGIPMLNSGK